jgi:alanine racemase
MTNALADRPQPIADPPPDIEIPPGVTGVLTIDLGAVVANWHRLRQRVGPGCTVAAVVKADAYGLGLRPVAQALADAGCRWFFVATLDEAAALADLLRPSHPECRVALIAGPIPGTAGDIARIPALVPVLNDLGQLRDWRQAAPGREAMLHLDTGMSRLGLEPGELSRLAAQPDLLSGVVLAGVMSHLACADTPEHPMNSRQRIAFEASSRQLPPAPRSLVASCGIFLGAPYHYDLVRPGAALYGLNPSPGAPNPMIQAIGLKARILQVREIDDGRSVGYGARWTARGPRRIATLGVGYADGILCGAGDRARVYVGSVEIPVIGRVSMDLITVDISAVPRHALDPNDFVDVLGPHYGVDALARDSGTVGYELLTRLGPRLLRVYRAVPH